MKKEYRIIISGGGTGGHIFPALSIADAIKAKHPEAKILFVGANNRMEMQRVPDAGYDIVGLPIAGFDRKNLLKNFKVLWLILKSQRMAKKIIKEFAPQAAVGVGGYASGPTLKMAAKMNIPTLIQEQNSYAGVTNKILSKRAKLICVAYDGMERFFPHEKIKKTGNPVRKNLLDMRSNRKEAMKAMQLDENKKCVLIVGGSLGARSINEGVLANIELIRANKDVQFVWQTGKLYFEEMKKRVEEAGKPENLTVTDFVSNMANALSAANLVVSRAGAGSISEFALLGKAVILVPSPNVSEDHQTKNAMALVEKDAAIYVADAKVKEELIQKAIETVNDDTKISQLESNIEKMGKPNAAEDIANEVMMLADAYIEKETRRKKENLK
ncbi:MAG: undecaprenyldiphospho-muramoylpentapeptide beta-N-acetylglucosaminyltransferase [Bacteroidaceae bacterium]|jgi:UDP-N-acetylglucosamine--N-acetylmuramyl-(pentapeptide) pyrophosphoryl-undecaprenol N-acetylglucosamine transferase|nr:undecaprenyldiphospho-muramoylpentapeptide beta-N-acetylglucosaminyltransferase [Bacteroidaceae bacterium]